MPWSKHLPPATIAQLLRRRKDFLDEDTSPNGGANGAAVADYIFDVYLIYRGVDDPEAAEGLRHELTALALGWDTDNPVHVHTQKFLNRFAAGDIDGAFQYLERVLEMKRVQPRAAAKRPRGTAHPLSEMVDAIVQGRPNITANELYYALRSAIRADPEGVPVTLTLETFRPKVGSFRPVPRQGLRNYLTRVRKKLSR